MIEVKLCGEDKIGYLVVDKIVAIHEYIDLSIIRHVPMTRVYTTNGSFVVLDSLDNFLQRYRAAFRSK